MTVRRTLLVLLVSLCGFSAMASSQTEVEESAPNQQPNQQWTCRLEFNADVTALKLIIGFVSGKGEGVLGCRDDKGLDDAIPVEVSFRAKPVSFGAGIGAFGIRGETTVDLNGRRPEDLLGKYKITGAQGAVLVGGGVISGRHRTHKEIKLKFNIHRTYGAGVNAGVSTLTIKPRHDIY